MSYIGAIQFTIKRCSDDTQNIFYPLSVNQYRGYVEQTTKKPTFFGSLIGSNFCGNYVWQNGCPIYGVLKYKSGVKLEFKKIIYDNINTGIGTGKVTIKFKNEATFEGEIKSLEFGCLIPSMLTAEGTLTQQGQTRNVQISNRELWNNEGNPI
ncbi:MAG: hypothetical protein VW397_04990 [Candidatus Margulisiibacteriota bacterium]